MTRCEFGDVVLVPFPFTDQSTSKKRPAVVVSSTAYNAERPDVIVMAITSQVRGENRFDLAIGDWQSAKLLKPSVAKPVVATLEQQLVIRKLGRLVEADRVRLLQWVRGLLG